MAINNKIKKNKISNFEDLTRLRKNFKNKKIGLAHGVFDLLHYGHLLHLEKAKSMCDILIISTTADKYISKGPERPFYNINRRLKFLSSIELVDFVLVSNYPSAVEVIKKLRPNFYFKGQEYADHKSDHTAKIEKEIEAINKCKGKVVYTNEPSLSSTKLINHFSDQLSNDVRQYLIHLSKKFNFQKIRKIFDQVKNSRVLVIGDTIIDKYMFTQAMGRSPKEQLITVKNEKQEIYGGGIIATANHISSFVKNCTLLTILGNNKNENKKVIQFIDKKINKSFFYHKNLSNLIKTRYLDRISNQKLFQTANSGISMIDKKVEKQILNYLKKNIKKFDHVILHDFGHGLFTNKIINFIQKNSIFLSLNTQTNSTNIGYNYITKYLKADYISIDEPEARLALQDNYSSINQLFYKLRKKVKFKLASITWGSNGAQVFDGKKVHHAPALTDKPTDTLGAGDAYFAISSLCSKVFRNREIIAFIGNVAGALKVSYLGHRKYINKTELLNYVKSFLNI